MKINIDHRAQIVIYIYRLTTAIIRGHWTYTYIVDDKYHHQGAYPKTQPFLDIVLVVIDGSCQLREFLPGNEYFLYFTQAK